MASGNRLKANLEGYMPQRCMLALCFLSKGLKNQCSQHLDTRRWFPHTASDSTSFWGEEQGTCYQAKMWLVDREFPTTPEGSHAPWEDKVYACLCNKAKQMETLEEEKAAKNEHHHGADKYTQRNLFPDPWNLISIWHWSKNILVQGEVPERLSQ